MQRRGHRRRRLPIPPAHDVDWIAIGQLEPRCVAVQVQDEQPGARAQRVEDLQVVRHAKALVGGRWCATVGHLGGEEEAVGTSVLASSPEVDHVVGKPREDTHRQAIVPHEGVLQCTAGNLGCHRERAEDRLHNRDLGTQAGPHASHDLDLIGQGASVWRDTRQIGPVTRLCDRASVVNGCPCRLV